MISRIAIVVNWNMYESKRHFVQKLSDALQRKGVTVKVLDLQQVASPDQLIKDLVAFAPDVYASFNSITPFSDGTYLQDRLRIPFFAMLVDPSLYSVKLTNSPYSIISCVDREDCKALESMPFKNVFFMPHAVERELQADANQKRPYDAVFIGSCNDYEGVALAWQEKFPPHIHRVFDEAVNLVLSDKLLSVVEALALVIGKFQQELTLPEFLMMYEYLDTYTRGKDRVELIRAVADAGVHVHVFGEADLGRFDGKNDWSYYLKDTKNVTLHPSVPYTESLNILKQSKFVLNSMPFFKDGTHERIFNALACGAVPLTSATKYLKENFKHNQDLLFYNPPKWKEAGKSLVDLLKDEKRRAEIAAKGRAIVMQNHTWDNRADEIVKVLPGMIENIHATAK